MDEITQPYESNQIGGLDKCARECTMLEALQNKLARTHRDAKTLGEAIAALEADPKLTKTLETVRAALRL